MRRGRGSAMPSMAFVQAGGGPVFDAEAANRGRPTTDSDTAARRSPTRSRTAAYATPSERCIRRTAMTSGMKHPHVTAARIGLYQIINAVARVICPRLTISMIPPNWTNWLIVSTSEVTRETIEPRRSAFWVSTDRSWMCRKAVTRKVAKPALRGGEEPHIHHVCRGRGQTTTAAAIAR